MSEINTGGSLGERMVTGRNWYGDGQGWRASVRQCRQRELKVGGTSLVSRLSACLTEANWWRLIAE